MKQLIQTSLVLQPMNEIEIIVLSSSHYANIYQIKKDALLSLNFI